MLVFEYANCRSVGLSVRFDLSESSITVFLKKRR